MVLEPKTLEGESAADGVECERLDAAAVGAS
jgi:hypothetical protein